MNVPSVIQEQGFPMEGANLGFTPLNEDDRKKVEEYLKRKEEQESSK